MNEQRVYTLSCGSYTFQFRPLQIGDSVRLKDTMDCLQIPFRMFFPAYDAFRVACMGYGGIIDRLKAGIVANVGIVILNHSRFLKPIEEVQEDLEMARDSLIGFYDKIRSMAMAYFHYKLDESAGWDYYDIMEMAARLEMVTGQDLSLIQKEEPTQEEVEEYQRQVHRQQIEKQVRERTGGVSLDRVGQMTVIRKGDTITTKDMTEHNKAMRG